MRNRNDPPQVGDPVFFVAPTDCQNDGTPSFYAAIVTVVRDPLNGDCDLVTFGPNSIYFNHNIPYAPLLKAGHWCHKFDLAE